jgi:hypothetical protein
MSWGAGLPNKQNKADKVLFIQRGDITSWGFFYLITTTEFINFFGLKTNN